MSLNILIIDDEEEICISLKEYFEFYGYNARYMCQSKYFLKCIEINRPDVILLDLNMPGIRGMEILSQLNASGMEIPIIIISGHATIKDTVQAMKLGALNLYPKPVDMDTLLEEVKGLEAGHSQDSSVIAQEEILTQDPEMIRILNMAKEAAKTDATILITGESGTGKELIANTVHKFSQRSGKPFVKVNCAAIMQTLLESEIFGHEKGGFYRSSQPKDRVI